MVEVSPTDPEATGEPARKIPGRGSMGNGRLHRGSVSIEVEVKICFVCSQVPRDEGRDDRVPNRFPLSPSVRTRTRVGITNNGFNSGNTGQGRRKRKVWHS